MNLRHDSPMLYKIRLPTGNIQLKTDFRTMEKLPVFILLLLSVAYTSTALGNLAPDVVSSELNFNLLCRNP